jgi:hypothetical protein
MKGGNPADPYMGSEIDTWTTVGAASIPSTIPTDPTTIDPSKRYDSVLYNIHGFFNAGSVTDSNGITTTNLRGIDTLIKSAQDDDIHVRVWDNAGYDYPVASSWADVNIPGHNGESQKFRQFNFADSRTWDLKSYNWINDMNIQYQEFPISFNEA